MNSSIDNLLSRKRLDVKKYGQKWDSGYKFTFASVILGSFGAYTIFKNLISKRSTRFGKRTAICASGGKLLYLVCIYRLLLINHCSGSCRGN